ncbi:MAG: hypothetical protein FK733_04930 [Asgard group archaeon]|nr:hypothetical protein [Asgard group archaeon]
MYSNERTKEFEKKINDAIANSTVDIIKIKDENEYDLAIVSKDRIKVLTRTQQDLFELLIDGPRTGAELSVLTGYKDDNKTNPHIKPKSPQFISKYMGILEDYGIVAKIDAPFGHSKVYVITAEIFDKDRIKKVQSEAIPDQLQAQLVKRGEAGNLLSLTFKEILDMIRDLSESEKQKVLDFIIQYCQVEGA